MIHKKFLNMFDQKQMSGDYNVGMPHVMHPSDDVRKNAVDRRQSNTRPYLRDEPVMQQEKAPYYKPQPP